MTGGRAYRVALAEQALRDITQIVSHIAESSGKARATAIFRALHDTCAALNKMPERGNVPKELAALGIGTYRELHFKPYRIVYEIDGKTVLVHAVLDGRRDMRTLLEQRMLS